MKKYLVLALLLLAASVFPLVSCTPDKDGGQQGNPDSEKSSLLISDLAVVYPESEEDYALAEQIWRVADSAYAARPGLKNDGEALAEQEIVVGNTSREITAAAFKALSVSKESSDYPMFLIYSDGSSLAVVYDDNVDARELVLKYIQNGDVVQNMSNLPKGVIYCNDIVSEQDIYDKADLAQKWADVEETVGWELAEELRDLADLYTDDLIDWFANLYEPCVCICDGECQNTQYCGGGGYYYSNSGRDTPGYLPDIESTNQALGWISSSGMTGGYHYNTVIPEWMENQIVRFVKARQESNGYFYHPQWSKESVDNAVSRRSRDLSWAISILEGFGVRPTYDTPTKNILGDGILWDGTPLSDIGSASCVRLTGRLSQSAVSAVSRITAVSDSLPSYLVSADGMREYLKDLDIKERSYHIGNDLAAIVSEVEARDAVLVANKEESITDVLINWLNDNQNTQNGLWDDDTDYYAVNGLFKITFVYNGLARPIPNVDKALAVSIEAITSSEEPSAVTDVYNTWYSVLNIVENIRTYQSEETDAADAALANLYSQAGEAIAKTREKFSLFRKKDGSFSYNQTTTSDISQGMPVAIPGTNEGDINATVIATTGTFNRIFDVLGLERIPLYTRSDLLKYFCILEGLDPVIKDEEPDPERITFTYDDIGKIPENVTCDFSDDRFKGDYYPANGGFEVITDTAEGSKRGRIFKIESVKGIYNAVRISAPGSSFSSQCFVFEGDICVPTSSADYAIRMRMSDAYALAFKVSDGKVNLWDVSSSGTPRQETDLGIAIDLGEWFNLKVEFYKGAHDTVRIKVYINGELSAVSDNYYDQYGKKITNGAGTPATVYSYVSFSTMADLNTTLLLDNLMCYRTSARYEPYTDTENPLWVNVDAPDPGVKIYDFEDSENESDYPEDFTVSGSGTSVKSGADKELNIISSTQSPAVIEIPTNIRAYGAGCSVMEMNIRLNSAEVGATLRLTLCDRKDPAKSLAIFDFVVTEYDGKKYLTVADAHEGVTAGTLHSLMIPMSDEHKLTVEHYAEQKITIIYLDGEPVTGSNIAVNNASVLTFGLLRLSYIGSSAIDVSLDDIKVESIIKKLSVEEYDNEKIYTFAGGATDGAILDGAGVTAGAAKLSAASGSITLPVNIRCPLITVTTLTAKLTVSNSGEYLAVFKNAEGKIIVALRLVAEDGILKLYEYTENGSSSLPLAEIDCKNAVSLGLNWYRTEQILTVTVNGKHLASTSLYYSDEAAGDYADTFCTSSVDGNGYITLDDMSCESSYRIFEIPEGAEPENPENDAEVITFESTSSATNLPSAITYKLSSPGASFKIEQLIRDGKLNRVISMTSNVGGNDAVRIGLTKRAENATCVTFLTDMYIDFADSSSWRNMQFWIQTKDGSSSAYMFEIWDSLFFSENGGSSNVVAGFTGVRTWFTLKVEYYDGGYVIVYVNDTPIYTGDGYRGKTDGTAPIPAANIERINLYPYGNFAVTYKLDNISLIQEIKDYVAPEIEKEEENELGKIEDTLTFEDGLVNEATDFASGSINGTTLTVEQDEDENHVLVLATPASSAVNNILNVLYTKADVSGANGIAFEFDVNISYTKSDDYLYVQLRDKNGASAAFISIENNAVVVYSSGSSYQIGSVALTKDAMSRVRVEYGDTESGVFLRIYVNGSVTYENAAYLSRDGKAIPSSDISHVELSTWRQITARMDNITFGREILTVPEIKEPEPEETLPEVFDFEDGELPSSLPLLTDTTSCIVEENEERGKYLNFTATANTYGTGFYVPVLTDEEGANCIAFEADMSLNVLSGTGLRLDMLNSGGNRNMWFEVQKNGSNLYFLLYTKASSSTCYAASSEPIAVNGSDNWFNLRVEYYEGERGAVRTKAYVNGALVFVSDMFVSNGSCGCSSHGPSVIPAKVSDTEKIRIFNAYSAYSGTLYIDNIKLERIVKECADDAITAQRP